MSAAPQSHAPPDHTLMRKLMTAGLVGSSIEWYDFFVYGTAAALVFNQVFFPEATPLVGTLAAFGTFWAGFVARPLGGLVFGHIGDRIGRKPAVLLALVMVTTGTFLIGCLPPASTIGVAAPILLVVLRFVQGLAVGGQWGGVILLLTETAMPGRRGRAGSFGQMGVPGGLFLGTLAFLVVGALVPGEAFATWGWRIPFWLSALLLPVVIFIHNKVEETPDFQHLKETSAEAAAEQHVEQAPIKDAIVREWRRILLGAGLLFSSNAFFYVSIVGVLDYATRELGMNRDSLLLVLLIASLTGVFVILWAGSTSDRIGRKPLMIVGAVVMALWAFPYFWLVDTASWTMVLVAGLVGGAASSLVYGPYAAVLGELFPANVRYSSMSIAYQIGAILISGGTPFIMTWLLLQFDTSAAVSAYLLVVALISVFCAFKVQETHPVRGTAGTGSSVVTEA